MIKERTTGTGRLQTLDLLRGLTLVSMILYHGMWDFIYLTGPGAGMEGLRTWYEGAGGHLWQQSICRTFILLSGFCVPFSRRIFRRGWQVFGGGLVVSAVTLLAMYEERVIFGVLTFLGTAMLLTGAADRHLRDREGRRRGPGDGDSRNCAPKDGGSRSRLPEPDRLRRKQPGPDTQPAWKNSAGCALAGLALNLLLFYMTRWVNLGFVRLGPGIQAALPSFLYVSAQLQEKAWGKAAGWLLTALGFPMKGFFSTDYFSLFPWIFLFRAGICLHRTLAGQKAEVFRHPLFHVEAPLLNWMGRHSLLVYLLHQPVLYLLISLGTAAGFIR